MQNRVIYHVKGLERQALSGKTGFPNSCGSCLTRLERNPRSLRAYSFFYCSRIVPLCLWWLSCEVCWLRDTEGLIGRQRRVQRQTCSARVGRTQEKDWFSSPLMPGRHWNIQTSSGKPKAIGASGSLLQVQCTRHPSRGPFKPREALRWDGQETGS